MGKVVEPESRVIHEWDQPMFSVEEYEVPDKLVAPPETAALQGQSLAQMQKRVYQINVANGWFEDDRRFGEDIALLHSEVSEALEAYRDWGMDDATFDDNGEPCEFRTAEDGTVVPKPQGVAAELADVLVRLLDTCERQGVDLFSEFDRVCRHNELRGYRHGNRRL